MRRKMVSRRFSMEDIDEETTESQDDELLVEKIARHDKLPSEVADPAALASEREEIREEIEEAMDNGDNDLDDAENDVDEEEDPQGIEDSVDNEQDAVDDEDSDDVTEESIEVSKESLKLRTIADPLHVFHQNYVQSVGQHVGSRGCLNFEDISSSYTRESLLTSAERLFSSTKSLVIQFEEKTQKVYDGLKKVNKQLATLEKLHEEDQTHFNKTPVIKGSSKAALIPLAIGDKIDYHTACQDWLQLLSFLNVTIKALSEVDPTAMSALLQKSGFEQTESKSLVHKKEYPGGTFLHVRVDLPLDSLMVETEVNEVFFVRHFGPSQINALPSRLSMSTENAQGAFYEAHLLCDNTVASMETKAFIYNLVDTLTQRTNTLIESLQPDAVHTDEKQGSFYEQLRLCFEKYVQVLILTDLYLKTTNQLQEVVSATRKYIETFIEIKN